MEVKKPNEIQEKPKVICYIRTGSSVANGPTRSEFAIYDFSTRHLITRCIVFSSTDLMIDCEYKAVENLARYLNKIQLPSNCHILILTGDKRTVVGLKEFNDKTTKTVNSYLISDKIREETMEQITKLQDLGNDVEIRHCRFNILEHLTI